MSESFAFGVSAALAAPFVMTLGFIIWDNSWTGSSFALNLFKCNLAAIGFFILSATTRTTDAFPADVFTKEATGFLILSATVGIVIGDYLWLEGLRLLGATRVILIDTAKPFFAVFMGWAILGEELRPAAFGGMVLTVGGILVVSLESQHSKEDEPVSSMADISDEMESAAIAPSFARIIGENLYADDESVRMKQDQDDVCIDSSRDEEKQPEEEDTAANKDDATLPAEKTVVSKRASSLREKRTNTTASLRVGYIYSAFNVILDTYGSVLTKQYGQDMTPWEISLVRFGFSGLAMLLVSVVMTLRSYVIPDRRKKQQRDGTSLEHAENSTAWYLLPIKETNYAVWMRMTIGVLLVTLLTPVLSTYALFKIALALALTLTSIGPLYALPLSWLMQGEKPTLRALIGAILCVSGVILLSFFGSLQ